MYFCVEDKVLLEKILIMFLEWIILQYKVTYWITIMDTFEIFNVRQAVSYIESQLIRHFITCLTISKVLCISILTIFTIAIAELYNYGTLF